VNENTSETINVLEEIEKREKKWSMKVIVKGRKTGTPRKANVWFFFRDSKIYARTAYDRNWLKNVVANPNVTIIISDFGFQAVGEELNNIQNVDALRLRRDFRQKYRYMDYFVLWFIIRGKETFVRFNPGL
jgi:uncharacterized pyridoxamine 5'-phosphate oxidase family protein